MRPRGGSGFALAPQDEAAQNLLIQRSERSEPRRRGGFATVPKTGEGEGLKTPRPRQRERVFAVYTTLTRLASLGCPLPKTGEGEGLKPLARASGRGSSR